MALSSLIICRFEKFFHHWEAEIMAGHSGLRPKALRRPLRFYAGKSRRAGVISASLCQVYFNIDFLSYFTALKERECIYQ